MLKIAWDRSYILSLPVNHRFPMSKYEVLLQQLLHEGTIDTANLFSPGPIEERWILLTHEKEYWTKLKNLCLTSQEARRTGFPITRELVDREVCNGSRAKVASSVIALFSNSPRMITYHLLQVWGEAIQKTSGISLKHTQTHSVLHKRYFFDFIYFASDIDW